MFMDKIFEMLKELPGTIGLYYKDMTSGEEICYNEDVAFTAASVIKLPIMMDVYKRVDAGEMSLSDLLDMKDFKKVGGCGAISSIDEDISLSLKSLIRLMITISDNTATNVLIRHVGVERLKQSFVEMGMEKTQVGRELYDMEAAGRGMNNYIVPKEIGGLLEALYNGTFVSKAASDEMIDILKAQQICHKIPDSLPPGVAVANKTGEVGGVTHDAGIVYGERPFVFVFASMETDTSLANQALRKLARICYDRSNG